jgi:hypothetical protein
MKVLLTFRNRERTMFQSTRSPADVSYFGLLAYELSHSPRILQYLEKGGVKSA